MSWNIVICYSIFVTSLFLTGMVVCIIIEGVWSVSSFLCKAHERLDRHFFLLFHSSRPERCDHIPPPPPCAPPRPRPCLFSLQSSTKPLRPLIMSTHVWWFLHCLVKWRPAKAKVKVKAPSVSLFFDASCFMFYGAQNKGNQQWRQ